eukprot:gene19028-21644_t
MSRSQQNLLRLLSLVFCIASFTCNTITQVSYFSFITPTTNSTAGPRSNVLVYRQLLQSDDSPFASIDLPWKFNLLGENLNRLFISPNGGLHASPAQPCPPDNFFGSNNCDLRNSYFGVIGGMITDLNPHTSVNGNISSYEGIDHVTINYYKIAYYGTSMTNNFRIVLFKDSHIEIIYDEIFRNNNLPANNLWTSGLRGYQEEAFAYFSPEQRTSASAEWGNTGNIPGIYPSKASVITGNQFNICPVARLWCASPNVVSRNTSAASNPSAFITFTTTLLSCVNIVQYGVVFSTRDASISSANWSLPCEVVQNTTVQCEIRTLLSTSIPAGQFNVTPAWRQNSADPFQALLVDSLLITVVNNSLYNSTTQTYDTSIGCANNAYATDCAGDSCALCQGDNACLDFPCSTSSPSFASSNIPVGLSSAVYDRLTCSNTCPVFTTNSSNVYFTDFNQTCCAESAMDCSGLCGGVSEIAKDGEGAVICCSPPHKADCAGVCDGAAQINQCGICGGATEDEDGAAICCSTFDCAGVCGGTAQLDQCGICEGDGLTCYDPAEVTIATNSGGNSFYPVYDITIQSGWQQNLWLNVTNRSKHTIIVKIFEDAETLAVNPVLTRPSEAAYVLPNSWVPVMVSSSIASLLQSNSTTWANKRFTVKYERNVTSDPSAELVFFVYPQVTGCGTLHSARSECLRLPGCIYCFTNPYMRLLRGVPESEVTTPWEANTSTSRQLFIELLPPVQGQAENHLYAATAHNRVG